MKTFDVSVVVCTYNRAAMLPDALDSLCRLLTDGRLRYEVVVVNNASTDNTSAVIDDFSRRTAGLVRGVDELRPGVAAARNAGVRASESEWIAFFDDDQLADSRWLLELMDASTRRQCRMVGGAVHLNLVRHEANRIPPICRMLLGESLGRGVANAEFEYGRQSPGTGNLLVHRSVFDQIGLFDETLTSAGEDTDLYTRAYRAGIAAWYTPQAIVFHQIPEDRLTAQSLQWSARRIGSHVARRDHREQGVLFGPLAALRVGYGFARTAALQLQATIRCDHWTHMNAGCRWAFTRGYLRGTLAELAPSWFSGGRFFDQLSFRHKGDSPAATSTGAA